MTVSCFEELKVRKAARALARDVCRLTSRQDFRRQVHLARQMQRAAISVPSNIAEGFERGGRREFIQFLVVAKGSAGELRAQLYVALDLTLLAPEEFASLRGRCGEVSRMLAGLCDYLKRCNVQGIRYKVEERKL